MQFSYLLDGAKIERSVFEDLEKRKLLSLSDITPIKNNDSVRLNYVGFSINDKEETLTVFPKHFATENTPTLENFAPIFRAVQMVQSETLTMRWGKESLTTDSTETDTNYPFGAFFQVLDYYHQYGLHFDEARINSRDKGKVNWKKTMSKATLYLTNNKIVPFPLRRESIIRTAHFVTDAMIYVINHTVKIFGSLLNIAMIPYQTSIQPDTRSYPFIISKLQQIRTKTFNDRLLNLLDSLIDFFGQTNYGQGYYFKIRNFAFVWQVAVAKYMQDKFEKLDSSNSPVFSINNLHAKRFSNLKVKNINNIYPHQYIDIDHYWVDENKRIQYVFDAKYYNSVSDLNYKQIFYTLIQSLDIEFQGFLTVSALVLPATSFTSRPHFSLTEQFSNQLNMQNPTLEILEIYLDCKSVLEYFQSTS